MFSNASILSVVPVTSMITARLVTSTTLPRKISAICISSPRCTPSAATLNRASSRATVSAGSRSRILSTLMSLCSCLVTWSIGCSAPSTVRVTRDICSSSVGPTVRVSMLKPRLANSPAILVRTPDLFSTRIDSTCLRPVRRFVDASSSSRLSGAFVPGSPISRPPSSDHLASRLACGDHRVGVLLAGHAHIDHHRAVERDRPLHVLHQGGLVVHPHPRHAVGLGELDEVGELAHVDMAVAAVPEKLLPLADHAQIPVVHDEHLDRDLVLRAGGELLRGHLNGAVAGDAADHAMGTADGCAHGRRQPEAHRPEAAGVHPAPRLGEVVVLRRPHLVLADVARDNRVASGRLEESLDHVLRLDLRVARVLIAERILL